MNFAALYAIDSSLKRYAQSLITNIYDRESFLPDTQDAELLTKFVSAEIKMIFVTPRQVSKSLTWRDSSDILDSPDFPTGKLEFSVFQIERLVNISLSTENEEIEDGATIYRYALRDPLLFGDYRNVINKSETRYYEDLLDYEAIYFLFQEVGHISFVDMNFF